MGPSGSGKSTLMNILSCLDRPTSGSYLLDGTEVSEISDNRLAEIRNRKIGFVFQSFNLLPRISALENVMLPLLYSKNKSRARDRALEALEQVGLAKRSKHKPKECNTDDRYLELFSVVCRQHLHCCEHVRDDQEIGIEHHPCFRRFMMDDKATHAQPV